MPFDPERLAALARVAARINGAGAPPPFALAAPDASGRIAVPIPDAVAATAPRHERVLVTLHPGLTLAWAPGDPISDTPGVVLSFVGGPPTGEPDKDGVAAFLTPDGLAALIRDLQAIAARIAGES